MKLIKTINNYCGMIAFALVMFSIFTGGNSGDYISSLGNLLEFRESGTNFTIRYNDTTRFTIPKLSSSAISFGSKLSIDTSSTLNTGYFPVGSNNANGAGVTPAGTLTVKVNGSTYYLLYSSTP